MISRFEEGRSASNLWKCRFKAEKSPELSLSRAGSKVRHPFDKD